MRKCLLLLVMLMAVTAIKATHIVGGEVFYDCLGGSNYRITVKVYRDCGPNNINGTPFDAELPLTIYNAANVLVDVIEIPLAPATSIPTISTNPCLTPPEQCIEVAVYVTTVNLPPIPGGYTLVYQRCCRNASIQNLADPSANGGTYFIKIPGPEVVTCNSSPRFSNLPPLVICANDFFSFNHSATDPDGDVLEYSFYTPYEGGSTGSPAPNPCEPPPYVPLVWAAGYSETNQIHGTPNLTINSTTGQLTCNPSTLGIYVYAVKVREYRGGVLLSEALREFQINVVNCEVFVLSGIQPQFDPNTSIPLCSGLTATFTNTSVSAFSYLWNFGDETTLADTSNLTTPTYTFPDTGTYMVTLIANPYTPCSDTIQEPFKIFYPLDVIYPRPVAQCVTTNSFDILATGHFDANAVVTWDAPGAVVPALTGNPVNNITYPDSGLYPVTVTVKEFGCTESYTDTLFVYPMPVIGFSYPQQLACQPYTILFSDTSLSWSPVSYLWNFGDGHSSTEPNPTHTYLDTGLYDLTLTIEIDTICITTQTLRVEDAIHVFPTPHAQMYVTPHIQSILTPTIEVQDIAQGHIEQIIYFDDGDSTLLPSATHYYQDTGWYNITQWVINEHGCTDTAVQPIYMSPVTSLFVPNSFTPNGDGLNEIWLPVVRDVRRYELLIFNRWGEVIFSTTDPLQGWDGKINSKKMETEVYVYKIKFMDQQYIEHEKVGHFSLLK